MIARCLTPPSVTPVRTITNRTLVPAFLELLAISPSFWGFLDSSSVTGGAGVTTSTGSERGRSVPSASARMERRATRVGFAGTWVASP